MFGFQPVPDDAGTGLYIPPDEDPGCFARGLATTTTSGTSHTVNMPTFSYPSSNCVLVLATEGDGAAPTVTGWTLRRSILISYSFPLTARLSVYTAASAGLGSTITVGTSSSADLIGFAYEVTCDHLGGGQSDGGSKPAVPPTPSGPISDDVLQMCAIMHGPTGSSVSAFSSGYTTEYHAASNGKIGLAVGWKQVTGGVEKPGDITTTSTDIWAIAVEVF